jgi:peptidoglycan/xylan/chitin deacetylase (PgdA/CDA1 family)
VNNRDHPSIYPDNIVSIQNFEKQIKYLLRKKKILSLMDVVESIKSNHKLPGDGVVLTFDDGYYDFYTKAMPILRRFKVPCTIFPVTGLLNGSTVKWDDRLTFLVNTTPSKLLTAPVNGERKEYALDSSVERRRCILDLVREIYTINEEKKTKVISEIEAKLEHPSTNVSERITMSWTEVMELRSDRDHLISFGAHSYSHPNLVEMPIHMAEKEIAQSKQEIESRLGLSCKLFSYPFGVFNDRIKELLKAHHFSGAVTTIPGSISPKADCFELRRVHAIDDASKDFGNLLKKVG